MTEEQAAKILRQGSKMAWDAEEFCEAYDMGIKALERQSGEDCVSRQAVLETIDDCNSDGLKGIFCSYDDGERFKEYIKNLPPITPTQCIAVVRFSKEDLREISNERIEIECTHGTCKDCKKYRNSLQHCTQWVMSTNDDFYCADYEKAR